MPVFSLAASGSMAVLHSYIMVLEMFLWTTPRGRKAFGLAPAFAEQTKTLAKNQGLYNGFLAAGLVWGLAHPVPAVGRQLQLFFNSCVAVAGIYGGLTANKKILLVQGLPGVVSVGVLLLGL